MKRYVWVLIAALLCLPMQGLAEPEPMTEPPTLFVSAGGQELPNVMGLTHWNGAQIKRADVLATLAGDGQQHPYVALDSQVTLILDGPAPDKIRVTSEVIREDGTPKYPTSSAEEMPLTLVDDQAIFTLSPDTLALVDSSGTGTEIQLLRGFRVFCTWGENECEYGFILQTDMASPEVPMESQNDAKYKTEADFLNHPDGVKFQAAAFRAAKAYLNGDLDELAGYLTDSYTVEHELDLFKDIDYMVWKWSLHDMKSEDNILASYQFVLKGEDSASYVTMELIKLDGEWKVDFIGLEK